jgi:ubiquinone/menaquinone biosynthesis C-methylase UbiE
MSVNHTNQHNETVSGFGDEWSRYDQSKLSKEEHAELFQKYFEKFPWDKLPKTAVGFDLGSGSGRWAKGVAPRVGTLHCIDASSEALEVAKRNLKDFSNCQFHHASVDQIPLGDNSVDFGYSLGVLHHVPDTLAGLKACVAKLKPGTPFLLYLYYAFDNRPAWFRGIWKVSDLLRTGISKLPNGPRNMVCEAIAAGVYFPLAKTAHVLSKAGMDVDRLPLSFYRDRSFYTMRTDARDRFGTSLEQRFTKAQIEKMMTDAGLKNIDFNSGPPYWTAVGFKK